MSNFATLSGDTGSTYQINALVATLRLDAGGIAHTTVTTADTCLPSRTVQAPGLESRPRTKLWILLAGWAMSTFTWGYSSVALFFTGFPKKKTPIVWNLVVHTFEYFTSVLSLRRLASFFLLYIYLACVRKGAFENIIFLFSYKHIKAVRHRAIDSFATPATLTAYLLIIPIK